MINSNIIIGLGTIGRSEMLRKTLESLQKLNLPHGYKVSVAVADNSPNEETKSIVTGFQNRSENLQFIYLEEERRGIVYMRNSILAYAKTLRTALLAFIDDDEIVHPDWLIKMIEAKEEYQADVVVGRVSRILPDGIPKWVKKGSFFERPNIKNGTVRRAASTSNVLFDFPLLIEEMKLAFHPALNLSGSSDTHLFTKATKKGAKIIWLNDDLVKETIPTSRANIKWLLKRAFRHTNCRTLRKRIDQPYLLVLLTESGYGILHFLLAFGSLPINIFKGKAGLVHTMRFFWKGMGSFAGLGGYVYREYEEIHGS